MLPRLEPALPSEHYVDPLHFEKEVRAIFARQWMAVGREGDWPQPGCYRRIDIGGRQVIVVRDRTGRLNAFYNTCRHRGSALCADEAGRFKAGRIVCPYHAWAYDLEGRLLKTSPLPDGFEIDREGLGLYPVPIDAWAGFVFINLDPKPRVSVQELLGEQANLLDNWDLEHLALAHRETHTVQCNWKIFWENFLECLHCPGIHPDLCSLVPKYGEGVLSRDDLPEGHRLRDAPSLRAGAVTWTADGKSELPAFPGLSRDERDAGMTFVQILPTMFVIAHIDHVRSVRLMPLGPGQTELTVDWFVAPEVLNSGAVDIERLTAFGRQVVLEDARACELNHLGLRNNPTHQGLLMPQEYDVHEFHLWLRDAMEMKMPDGLKA